RVLLIPSLRSFPTRRSSDLVKDGVYPAIALAKRDSQIGDPVHILGFPGVVLSHELLNKSAALEASVTNGAVSGFKQDTAPLVTEDRKSTRLNSSHEWISYAV